MDTNSATLIYAPLFGLLFAGLCLTVVILRVQLNVPFGMGNQTLLLILQTY